MKNKEFVEKLYTLAGRPNKYCNKYPKNLCYYDGEAISTDCYGLIKSIIWDPEIVDNYTVGKYAKPNKEAIPDYTIAQMMDICTYTSEDFSNLEKIPAGAILEYDTSLGYGSHAGVYVGDGKVVEATAAWGGGILISDISTTGARSKDGKKAGRWMKWGTLPQITFISEPEPNTSSSSLISAIIKIIKAILSLFK